MLVRERMSAQPITIPAEATITEALRTMRNHEVRRLPVLNAAGQMVGIVAEKDLLYASPSPATSLSIYEMHDLLSRLHVSDVMTTDVTTVTPDTAIEEAARVMADNKIGGLPVLENGRLVGIITETDIFRIFVEMLGARARGLRLTLGVPSRQGEIARITSEITGLGGNILAVATVPGDEPTMAVMMVKVADVPTDTLVAAMRTLGLSILDAREV